MVRPHKLKNKNKKVITKGDIKDSNYILGTTKDVDCIINLAAIIGIPFILA
jgi:hypothetical protein